MPDCNSMLQEDIDYCEKVYSCRPGKYIECALLRPCSA